MFKKSYLLFYLSIMTLLTSMLSYANYASAITADEVYTADSGDTSVEFTVMRKISLAANDSIVLPSVVVQGDSGYVALIGDGGANIASGGDDPAFVDGVDAVAGSYTLAGLSPGKEMSVVIAASTGYGTGADSGFIPNENRIGGTISGSYTSGLFVTTSTGDGAFITSGTTVLAPGTFRLDDDDAATASARLPVYSMVCMAGTNNIKTKPAVDTNTIGRVQLLTESDTYSTSTLDNAGSPCSKELRIRAKIANTTVVDYVFIVNLLVYLPADVTPGSYTYKYLVSVDEVATP